MLLGKLLGLERSRQKALGIRKHFVHCHIFSFCCEDAVYRQSFIISYFILAGMPWRTPRRTPAEQKLLHVKLDRMPRSTVFE